MIRINLLTPERDDAARPVVAREGPDLRVTIGAVVILASVAAGIGWWYWSLEQASVRLDQDLAAAEQEAQRLRTVIDQVNQYDAQREQLQQRVTLIEALRRGQGGPVHLLDALSRALPENMWFIEMKQEEDDITIDGRATSLTALSDFVGGLEGSGYFAKPVEILNSQVEPATEQSVELIRFTVRATFVPPDV